MPVLDVLNPQRCFDRLAAAHARVSPACAREFNGPLEAPPAASGA